MAPQCLWDTVFATYQPRWKTRVFLENNGSEQGILLHKIPPQRLAPEKLTHLLPLPWTLKSWKSLDTHAEQPVKGIPWNPQQYENFLTNNNEVIQTLQSFYCFKSSFHLGLYPSRNKKIFPLSCMQERIRGSYILFKACGLIPGIL